LTSDYPVFFLDLFHPDFSFSSRAVTLLPDERLEIQVTGDSVKNFNLDEVQVFMLNKYSEV
jgi:hypothetical protein